MYVFERIGPLCATCFDSLIDEGGFPPWYPNNRDRAWWWMFYMFRSVRAISEPEVSQLIANFLADPYQP